MRALAAVVAVAVAAASPVAADARLRAKVHHKVVRKAPKRWRHVAFSFAPVPVAGATPVSVEATPAPVATAAPTPTPTPVATPKPPALPPANPHSLSVRSTEFAFKLSQSTVSAGDTKIQFDNSAAEDPHDLEIDDAEGAQLMSFGEQPAGSVTTRTVALTAGTYTLLCPIPGHASLGMKATLTVSG